MSAELSGSTVGIRAIPMEQLYEMMLPKLEQGGSVSLTVSGCSMHPMLRHRKDSVVLHTAGALKRGDLILYRRDNGSFVLHRIVRVHQTGDFTCCGDNQYEPETVARRQVLAIVTEFTRKGKTYQAQNAGYRLYVWLWVTLFPVRRPILAARRVLGKLRKKLLRKK